MELNIDLYERIVNAKLFMDENHHEPIQLKDISEKAFLSRFHFHRLFTRIYRKTPHQYLTQARLDSAKSLLQKEELSITEICINVGFESHGSFTTLFKKRSGFTPQDYRNMAWLKKQQAVNQPKKLIPHCFVETYNL